MTQNKLWLVCNADLENRNFNVDSNYKTLKEAKKRAIFLAEVNKNYEYVIFEATHSFKADVNITETFFEVNDDLLQDKYKFKLGDKVRILHYRGEFEISAIKKDKYNLTVYDAKTLTKENIDRYNLSETMIVHI